LRPTVAHAGLVGFDGGLNWSLLIGAAVPFAGALLTLVLIRERDFVQSVLESQHETTPETANASALSWPARSHDSPAGGSASGEGDLVDVRMPHEMLADFAAAGNDADQCLPGALRPRSRRRASWR
jgi:hypothetical protein